MSVHQSLFLGRADAPPNDPWRAAAQAVVNVVGNRRWILYTAVITGGVLGYLATLFIPPNYKATAQLFIDPRGLQVFANDLSPSPLDANAQINFVESQIGIIKSESVLLRVVRNEMISEGSYNDRNDSPRTQSADPYTERLKSKTAAETVLPQIEARTLAALQRAISVTRSERSFVLAVTVTDKDPQSAARLANAVVKAYSDEDSSARDASTQRLADDLGGRLSGLREGVLQSEQKVEVYRAQHGLTGARTGLILQQRLAMLEGRRAAATSNVAQLSATLGEKYPTLAAARETLDSVNRQIAQTGAEMEETRKAQTELQLLARKAASDRAVLEAFEKRAHEASEFGRINASNVRIIAEARPAEEATFNRGVWWTAAGGVSGIILCLLAFVVAALLRPSSEK